MSFLHKRSNKSKEVQPKKKSVLEHDNRYSSSNRISPPTPTYLTILLISSVAVGSLWICHFINIFFFHYYNHIYEGIAGKRFTNAGHENRLNQSSHEIKQHRDELQPIMENDVTRHYLHLRRTYDSLLPPNNYTRTKSFVQSLKKNVYTTARPQDMSYDIYNCPEDPPFDYPYAWNLLTVLNNWSPQQTSPHERIYQSLCVFDLEQDRQKALNYRNAEVPFITQNDPQILRTVERWNQPNYLASLLGNTRYMTELSHTNKYIYWNKPRKRIPAETFVMDDKWTPPTSMTRMSYMDWLKLANVSDPSFTGPTSPHYYFRLIGCGTLGRDCDSTPAEFLFDELPFFSNSKTDGKKIYIVDPMGQRGIHCRFGMKGIIIENHYDASRNSIVLLGGERRYILSHPRQCKYYNLFPPGHPSARHSAEDWTQPDLLQNPNFEHATVTELVLQAGDVLYLPTNWFHYIVNLDLNYQCNTRSGKSTTYDMFLKECGFADMLRGI